MMWVEVPGGPVGAEVRQPKADTQKMPVQRQEFFAIAEPERVPSRLTTMKQGPLRSAAMALMAFALIATACQSTDPAGTESTTTTAAPGREDSGDFDDHTADRIESVGDFLALARTDEKTTQSVVKFAIPDLGRPGVVWLDSAFYELHDEWYWFRLLNGVPVPGLGTAPVADGTVPAFATIDEVYAWASSRPRDLPLDLRFTPDGERLYSNRYYDLALRSEDKTYGLGSVTRFPVDNGHRWVIELEFTEATSPESVGQFIDRLAESLPDEVGDDLAWVVRSPGQEATALAMQQEGHPYADRIVHYADLVPRGEVTVYNQGLTAGRLRLIGDSDDLNAARRTDILVMENVPGWLPPASAILTSNPQTPLAHVNLLARNRGIPNVSISGLLDDPAIVGAARSRAYAVVSAGSDDDVQITLISREQFEQWDELRAPSPIVVPDVDLAAMPLALSLADLASGIDSEADVAALRYTIGGKSAGFLALLSAEGVTTPDTPLAVTVAPYFRHLEAVETELDAMLEDVDFRVDPRVRFLLLEGGEEYAEVYTADSDLDLAEAFSERHPEGPIRTILDADGFMNLFRDVEMNDSDRSGLTDVLQSTFGDLAESQGLRFRSSSSVEDIEGFTGAGLYDSNTGFLSPELQPEEGDRKKTVERTVKKTWASYWSFEAFEERRIENVDHRSGGMAVLVHPRFDDALEANNGVATFTLLPEGASRSEADSATSRVSINVQVGDVSVTNPDVDSGVLPEQIEVVVSDDGATTIDRLAPSTLAAGGLVLDDEAVHELVDQLDAVARLWRDRVNADLPEAQQIQTVTLDFEFKTMLAGWPAMADGIIRPSRLVVKQARSLDPGLRGLPEDVLDLPIPRDVLARAARVVLVACSVGAAGIEVFTDPLRLPDLGFDAEPWVVADDPSALGDPDCERSELITTSGQLLVEFLRAGDGLEIG